MPRPKTDRYWADRVAALTEEGLRPVDIFRLFEAEARDPAKRQDYPQQRTVERLVKEHRAKPEAERREAAYFHWPHSMLSGALPWEASRAALDLLSLYDENDWGRPTIRTARWMWRVTQAAPSLPIRSAMTLVGLIQLRENIESLGGEVPPRSAWDPEVQEYHLAYQPWRSDEDRQRAERHLDAAWLNILEAGAGPPPVDIVLTGVVWANRPGGSDHE